MSFVIYKDFVKKIYGFKMNTIFNYLLFRSNYFIKNLLKNQINFTEKVIICYFAKLNLKLAIVDTKLSSPIASIFVVPKTNDRLRTLICLQLATSMK